MRATTPRFRHTHTQHARGTVSDVVLVCVDSRVAAWVSALGKRCAVVTEIPDGHVRWTTAKGVRCADPYRRQTEDSLDECRQACLVDGPACHAASYDAGPKTCGFCREGASLVSDEAAATVRRQRHALLFQMRMRLLHHFAARGREVVLSDVDAMWLRDPLKELRAVGADVVAQRGSHPKLLAKRWGATACMGFVYVKGGPHVMPFLSDAVRLADEVGDDQEGFNTALVNSDVVWQRAKLEYDTSNAVDVGITSERFRVALLPHTKYRRLCAGELDHSVWFGSVCVCVCVCVFFLSAPLCLIPPPSPTSFYPPPRLSLRTATIEVSRRVTQRLVKSDSGPAACGCCRSSGARCRSSRRLETTWRPCTHGDEDIDHWPAREHVMPPPPPPTHP